VLELYFDFYAKKEDNIRKHLLRNNVATRCYNERCYNDAADPSHTRTRCCSYVYRRTSAKSC